MYRYYYFIFENTATCIHNIMYNFKINAQVCKYSLADLNIGHCVEFAFFEGKLDRFLVLKFLKWSYKTYCIAF